MCEVPLLLPCQLYKNSSFSSSFHLYYSLLSSFLSPFSLPLSKALTFLSIIPLLAVNYGNLLAYRQAERFLASPLVSSIQKERFLAYLAEMNSGSSDQLPQSFVNINWSRSIDHSGQLGSGFGSLMPSQSANSAAPVFGAPGNSSPKNFSKQSRLHQFQPQTMGRLNVGGNLSCLANLDQFLADPGFAERATRFSSFDGQNYGLLPSPLGHLENSSQLPVPNGVPLEANNAAIGIGREDLSASDPKSTTIEANNFGCLRGSNAMKRKSPLKSKDKDIASSKLQVADKDESNAKRPRPLENKNELGNESVKPKLEQIDGDKANGIDEHKQGKDGNAKPPEPPKDYIHVRARRGQATDSHSLAERVRREKISQRMKLLQDLVPGCSKVTGKAVMLDEIINYVQSLQRQVEFLSMKLATVNPHLDFDTLMSLQAKDMIQICGTVPSSVYPFEMSMDSSYSNQPQERNTLHSAAMNGTDCHSPMNMIDPTCHLNFSALKSCLNGFGDDSSQLGALWDDDLQSVVHMGIAQSLEIFDTFPTAQMKAEL